MEEIIDILESKIREMDEDDNWNFSKEYTKGYIEAMQQAIYIIENEV